MKLCDADRDSVIYEVYYSVSDSVNRSVMVPFWNSVSDSLRDPVNDSVKDLVWYPFWERVIINTIRGTK
jgi:hypothetical protein